jgi:class 3 adenylate cyclase/tetratricopeptide (TPR) repeat protein
VTVCPSCGAETPPGAAFCPTCGTALIVSSDAPRTEERRVVSVLFVDLVGFTERSDRADPEDVRRTLVPFHTLVKADIERYGGTLDKFIGDAAMGVFGAPTAHEDDPVRAVRAALRILESMEDLRRADPDLAVRVAVNTGEAIVAFGSGPQVGEAVVGDVVNTASRMQSLAPRGSVVVGEATAGRLRGLFDLEELPPASVKGKSEPLRVWRVVSQGPATGAPGPAAPTFIGRRRELLVLEDAFGEVRRTASSHTLTIVGEPGIGKSRLVQTLAERLGGSPRWLTGWCLPYGEGATFAPVADTVRALIGVAAAASPDATTEAVDRYGRLVGADDSERRWLSIRLAAVLGLGGAEGGPTVPAEEIADAWARVLGHVAGEGPVVLVIEDLHWAEATFAETLRLTVERLASRPILVLVSARPDVEDRLPGWVRAHGGADLIALAPLDDEETQQMVSTLLKQMDVTAPVRAELLDRAAGNPLYALEYARMLGERVDDVGGSVGTPETLRELIAARLDLIPGDLRSTASDASVIGDEFWASVVAELGRRAQADAREALGALVRRGLAEPWDMSSLDEPAYGFSHALIREVAYSRLPRRDRARRHLSAGRAIDRRAGDRASEHTDLLARHFGTAFELASAIGEQSIVDESREPAFRWSMAAADRAAPVDANRAFDLYDRAVVLAPPGRDRVAPLMRSAILGRRSGRLDAEAVLERLEEALAVARATGDGLLIGEALTRVGSQLGALGQTARSRVALAEAVRVLEELPPGRALAGAYAYRAEEEMFAGHVRESSELAGRAIAILEDAPDELVVMALHIRGDARCSEGDAGGLEDLRDALRLSEEAQSTTDIVTSRNYLGEWLSAVEGPAAAMREFDAAIELAERRGFPTAAQWSKATAVVSLFDLGDWDRALVLCEELLAVPEGLLDATLALQARVTRSAVALARGAGVIDDPDRVVALARNVEELQALVPALVMGATVAASRGDPVTARSLIDEFDSATRGVAQEYRGSKLAEVARTSVAVGAQDLLQRIASMTEARSTRDALQLETAEAVLAEARGAADAEERYRRAAEGWRSFGVPYEEALARLGRTRVALASGNAPDPDDEKRAQALLASLGIRHSDEEIAR